MQRYRVKIPNGVVPGGQFLVNLAGQQMRVTCPPNCGPGTTIEIQGPPMPGSTSSPSQPPPPPMVDHASASKPQCAASRQAEQQLASGTVHPSADLIFTAMDRDGSNSVDVDELQFGLSHGGRMKFSRKTCQLLVNMYDTDRDLTINRSEFQGLWGYLDQWRACFDSHDADKSGAISAAELKKAVQQVGYVFSEAFYAKIMKLYAKDGSGVSFDAFIQLFCELHSLTEAFKEKDTQRNGQATFQYEEFLNAAYALHT